MKRPPFLSSDKIYQEIFISLFDEHDDPQFRMDHSSFHYRAMDSPGATHSFYVVARARNKTPWERIRIAEAAAIAAMNTYDSREFMKYLVEKNCLPQIDISP